MLQLLPLQLLSYKEKQENAPPRGCLRRRTRCAPHWHAVRRGPARCPPRCRPAPEMTQTSACEQRERMRSVRERKGKARRDGAEQAKERGGKRKGSALRCTISNNSRIFRSYTNTVHQQSNDRRAHTHLRLHPRALQHSLEHCGQKLNGVSVTQPPTLGLQHVTPCRNRSFNGWVQHAHAVSVIGYVVGKHAGAGICEARGCTWKASGC